MTTTLAHPPAEDLGRFIEGTLDDAGRAAVVEHIADCDDCRIIVVDTTAFGEESAAKLRVASARWMAIAATVALALGGGVLVINAARDPLAPVIKESAGLSSRPVEARLSGFAYVRRSTPRGADDETDLATLPLESEVSRIMGLQGNSAKTLHAVGVANLIDASLEKVDPQANAEERQAVSNDIKSKRAKAIQDLLAAVKAAPNKPQYLSDLAAAYIAMADNQNLHLAVAICDEALKIDENFPDALFNRAIALRDLHDDRATTAFKRYLEVDPSSPWAEEAKQQIELLKPLS